MSNAIQRYEELVDTFSETDGVSMSQMFGKPA